MRIKGIKNCLISSELRELGEGQKIGEYRTREKERVRHFEIPPVEVNIGVGRLGGQLI